MYFSICIPTYNRANKIGRTLDSLVAQTYNDFEVLVIDDGSTDKTEEVVLPYKKKLNLHYVKKDNGGKHTALNIAIKEARGLFFIILDSDDWLSKEALEQMHSLCSKIEEDSMYSGVLFRSINSKDGRIIGDIIPDEITKLSYIDIHFYLSRMNIVLNDCCECNKTEILKRYKFPESDDMRFVPEAFIFDQIGMSYYLLTSNKGIKYVEYLENGISLDKDFKKKHIKGFLYHYISRLETILPSIDHNFRIKVIAWWRYWQAVELDRNNLGPRVSNVSLFGRVVKFLVPILNLYYKYRYRELYEKGR